MKIEEIMSRHVRGVNPGVDAESAWAYMQQCQVRHLVVVDGSKVVGMLSERDLGSTNGRALRAERTVRDLMTPHAFTLAPGTDVRDAAKTALISDDDACSCFRQARLPSHRGVARRLQR